MCDHIVGCVKDNDTKGIVRYIQSLKTVNDYIYRDEDNCLNILHLVVGLDSEYRDQVVEMLIEMRADLNHPGKSEGVQDIRAIHLAAMWGYDLTVKLLLYHGADVSLRDSQGLSPIDYASIFDNYACVSLLLRYGKLNSTESAWTAIMDSSLGESNANSSITQEHDTDTDDVHYSTALDFGLSGDDIKRISIAKTSPRSRTTFSCLTNRTIDTVHELMNEDEVNATRHLSDNKDDDDDYDPLDDIREEELDLDMDENRLRLELRRLGRNPGPITETTKKLYAKLLAHLIKKDKELVYSPRTTNKSNLNGCSVELNSILTGKFPIKQALDLEKDFIKISGYSDYHGPKQFFNYILIDPRISNNLPDQAIESSDSDNSRIASPEVNTPQHAMGRVNRRFNPKLFSKFIESIFYIGKGQKRRDLSHLYDALADRNSITQKKIDRIRGIWSDGYGVVSLHIFHNITSKEALTREAIMIETIGLSNLTNLLHGTLQFKLGWGDHKRKLLGALLLHRAYTQLLNEGERQLRRDDLNIRTNCS